MGRSSSVICHAPRLKVSGGKGVDSVVLIGVELNETEGSQEVDQGLFRVVVRGVVGTVDVVVVVVDVLVVVVVVASVVEVVVVVMIPNLSLSWKRG